MPSIVDREDERQLVQACAARVPGQWRCFVQRYDRLLRATAASVRRRRGAFQLDLDDLVANVYERLLDDSCRRLRAWRGESRFSTYLVQVAGNLCKDYIAKHAKGLPVNRFDALEDWLSDPADPAQAAMQADQLRALREALKSLPPKQAMILQLRLEGESLRRVACIMSLPKGTVFAENSRDTGRLRKILVSGTAPDKDADPHRSDAP